MNKKIILSLGAILVLFIALRMPLVQLSYYQDEVKTAAASEISLAAASALLTHPPLTALLFRADALVFGGTNMRVLPLLFGLLSALLLFVVARKRYTEHAALWATGLYAVVFYGVWASLMVDTDGAILPTLFLAALYCYDTLSARPKHSLVWAGLLGFVLILGLLVKLSFVLVIGALAVDFLIAHRHAIESQHLKRIGVGLLGGGGALVLIFLGIQVVNPAFQFVGMVAHARAYMHLADRNYLQIVVQSIKAVYYLSPLLIVPLIFLERDLFSKTRVFITYLGLSIIFYLVLFDFSRGALDKYLMVTIIPLCVLSGLVLSRYISVAPLPRWGIGLGSVAAALVIGVSFLPQLVVPLYPKTAWFSSVAHGHLNVLTPFNGGSGPLGFYVSFLVIFAGYACAVIAAVVGFLVPRWRRDALVVVLLVGLAYNALFIEEASSGRLYGSASVALQESLSFIETASSTQKIVTYNDIGAYELSHMGKYAGRFYAAPQFETGHAQQFAAYNGDFLVVGIPPLYDGFYSQYFAKCVSLFQTQSGVITSTVYSCGKAKK